MTANETVVVQINVEGDWMDYSRTTMEQARAFIVTERAGKYRGVDWISKRVVLPPRMTDAEALARGKELVNQCPSCGSYGYDDTMLRRIGRGFITEFDDNPTHMCAPEPEVHTVNERQPDSVTYNLGHNEQMQLAIAIGLIADVLREARTNEKREYVIDVLDLVNLSLDTIAHYEGLFSLPGLVSITKDSDD